MHQWCATDIEHEHVRKHHFLQVDAMIDNHVDGGTKN